MRKKYGPQTKQILAVIEKCQKLTDAEATALRLAWMREYQKIGRWPSRWNYDFETARELATAVGRRNIFFEVEDTIVDILDDIVSPTAMSAALGVGAALVVRDVLDEGTYKVLTTPWYEVMGRSKQSERK